MTKLSLNKAKTEVLALFVHTGGEGGIRTHGTGEGTTVFKTVRLNHSRTSP